jgi:2'-5' RNA ligase
VRCFAAVPLPADVRAALAEHSEALRRLPQPFKLVRREQMHVTLKFAGDVDEASAEPIRQALATIEVPRRLRLRIAGPGAFPPRGPARVAFAALEGDVDALAGLASALDRALAAFGVEREARPFHAHVTLGRAGNRGCRRDLVLALRLPPLEFEASAFEWIESRLGPEGPSYTTLLRVEFQASA